MKKSLNLARFLKVALLNKSIEQWIAGHYWFEIDALTQPDLPAGRQVQVREESPPYGDREQ